MTLAIVQLVPRFVLTAAALLLAQADTTAAERASPVSSNLGRRVRASPQLPASQRTASASAS